MAVESKLDPIIHLRIDSWCDLEHALNHNQQIQEEVSSILNTDETYTIEDAARNFDVGAIFNDARLRSKGFAVYSKIASEMSIYQAFLKRSFTLCNAILRPLFIRSFQCHQRALAHFTDTASPEESAIDAIVATGELAKTISSEYEQLCAQLHELANKEMDTLYCVMEEQQPIYDRLRALKEEKKQGKSPSDPSEKHNLKTRIASLDNSIKSLGRISTAFKKVSMILTIITNKHKNLADSSRIAFSFECSEQLGESKQNICESYLKWLAFAQINETMISEIKKAEEVIEKHQMTFADQM